LDLINTEKFAQVIVRPEQQGFLIFEGERGSTEIPCSPIHVADAERSVDDFLSGADTRRRLWFVSSWKFAVPATAWHCQLNSRTKRMSDLNDRIHLVDLTI